MAATIDSQIYKYFTWGSYPYVSWGGDELQEWGNSYAFDIQVLNTEQFSINEGSELLPVFTKGIGKNPKETLTVAERLSKNINSLKNELINIHESNINDVIFTRLFTESLNMQELDINNYSLYQKEAFGADDYSNRSVNKVSLYSLSVSENLSRAARVQRKYEEGISFLEKPINSYERTAYEQVAITDNYLKACEGVYSNLFITEGEFSDNDFENAINIAPAYTEFVDFKVGEYDYQEALVRITVTSNAQAQPTAQGIVMHVDIPDTDDRGYCAITSTAAPTEIGFNKHYYTVPEVQVTLRGANTSSGSVTPNIVEITTTHFTVELLTGSGTRTTGSISWASKGY